MISETITPEEYKKKFQNFFGLNLKKTDSRYSETKTFRGYFLRFLIENGIYEYYLNNFKQDGGASEKLRPYCNPEAYLLAAFCWYNAKPMEVNGFAWSDYNRRWIKKIVHIKELLRKKKYEKK